MNDDRGLPGLVADRHIIICTGSGGVGKTTTAAAIALEGARIGRRSCVVTIDPAKRLADALGLDALTNEPRRIEGAWTGPGELWALMLDTKTTFDDVVGRNAANPEQAQAIYANRFYRNISGALSGTQEYMAMEKLYELYHEQRFDLIVVDTPPTRHALDFLDAPRRLTRLLNNRIFRVLMMPTRAGLRAVNLATQLFLRTVARVIGGDVVKEAVAFFTAFEGMEQGFQERAERVLALLSEPATAFVLVAAPRRDAVEEALYFAGRLHESSIAIPALVVNRLYPRFGAAPTTLASGRPSPRTGEGAAIPDSGEAPDAVGAGGSGSGAAGGAALAALVANLADLDRIANQEEEYVRALTRGLPAASVVRVPFLSDDVHDQIGLAEVGRHLFAPSPS